MKNNKSIVSGLQKLPIRVKRSIFHVNIFIIVFIVIIIFTVVLSLKLYNSNTSIARLKNEIRFKDVSNEVKNAGIAVSEEISKMEHYFSVLENGEYDAGTSFLPDSNFTKKVDSIFEVDSQILYVGVYKNGINMFSKVNPDIQNTEAYDEISKAPIKISPKDLELSEKKFVIKISDYVGMRYLEGIRKVDFEGKGTSNYLLIVKWKEETISRYLKDSQSISEGRFYFVDSLGNNIFNLANYSGNYVDNTILPKFIANIQNMEYQSTGYLEIPDDMGKYLFFSKSDHMDGIALLVLPADYFAEKPLLKLSASMYIIMVCIPVVIAVFLLFKKLVLEPVNKVENALVKLVNGKMDIVLDTDQGYFYNPLSVKLNPLISSLRDLIDSQYNEKILRKQIQLNALQSQINPHFLYNTLDCIRGQALVEGVETIERMTKALSNFFRYSISRKENLVSFREELENVDYYLTIQQYRFVDKFNVIKDIDESNCPEILEYKMPKLTIQPIVENAIYHGLETKEEKGTIKISAYMTENRLIINIEDDGQGIKQEMLEAINNSFYSRSRCVFDDESKSGIALLNVDERIKLFFGEKYGLRLFSTYGMGTRVEIVLPLIKNITQLNQ
ncbi:MAG TPA: sensor histidine kinase [Clostridiaceae bacterium]|nr:sensor histidine kinase [Clostridiaceae bacterium]